MTGNYYDTVVAPPSDIERLVSEGVAQGHSIVTRRQNLDKAGNERWTGFQGASLSQIPETAKFSGMEAKFFSIVGQDRPCTVEVVEPTSKLRSTEADEEQFS